MESDARASLISDITSAFAGVRLGGGVGLFEAQGLDDYADVAERKALRERDEKDAWTVFSADALNCANSSLSFFDAERMRFISARTSSPICGGTTNLGSCSLCAKRPSVMNARIGIVNTAEFSAVAV